MKIRWMAVAVASVLAFCLVLAGCGSRDAGETRSPDASGSESKNESTGEVIELTMLSSWSPDTDRGRALHTIVDKFNQENAGKIKVTLDINPDWPSLQEKVKTMIAANQTPDIFNYNFNPNDLSRQQSGKLLDFSPYMDDEWRARFSEQDLQTLTINGELTSIPFEKAGILFYYNKDLFAQAGIREFPKTWDEFFEVCEQLKASGITPISLMTSDDAWHATNALSYFAASLGGTGIFDPGQPLDSPEMVQTAKYLKKLFAYTTPDALGGNYAVSSNHFIVGNTAMIIDGPWLIGSIPKDMWPSIGIAASPTFGDGKVPYGFTVTDTHTPWAAGKQPSKEREEAIVQFMKYMTSEESSKIFTLVGNILLSTKMELTDEEMAQAGPVLGQYIKINSQSTESLVNLVRYLKPAASAKIPSLIEGLVLDEYTPEEFAKQLQEANQ